MKKLVSFEVRRNPELPVLFLDVDGVLNTYGLAKNSPPLCADRVKLLNEIVPCDIVVSSTWRIETYEHFMAALFWLGVKHNVVGKTPELTGKNATRGKEIQAWLDANKNPHYAIVDDDTAILDSQLPHFIKTSGTFGLTLSRVRKINRILTSKNPQVELSGLLMAGANVQRAFEIERMLTEKSRAETAAAFGITPERVRQIMKKLAQWRNAGLLK